MHATSPALPPIAPRKSEQEYAPRRVLRDVKLNEHVTFRSAVQEGWHPHPLWRDVGFLSRLQAARRSPSIGHSIVDKCISSGFCFRRTRKDQPLQPKRSDPLLEPAEVAQHPFAGKLHFPRTSVSLAPQYWRWLPLTDGQNRQNTY